GVQGLCSAIPINMAKHILPQLMKHGRVVRGYLGLHARNAQIPERLVERHELLQNTAVHVVSLEQGAPADQAGILEDDLPVGLGGAATPSGGGPDQLLAQ